MKYRAFYVWLFLLKTKSGNLKNVNKKDKVCSFFSSKQDKASVRQNDFSTFPVHSYFFSDKKLKKAGWLIFSFQEITMIWSFNDTKFSILDPFIGMANLKPRKKLLLESI